MNVSEQIYASLNEAFRPKLLDVIDESEKHRGHAGYQEGGQSHFHVVISAPAFNDMTRIARHRAIHQALGADLIGRIHALSLSINA